MEHIIKTTKSASVFTHGELSKSTRHVWFVLHGYGQLASFFIRKFNELNPEEHFVIAPEALNRFYLQGTEGRVGASWMTKERRQLEIDDYIDYLDTVYRYFSEQDDFSRLQVHVLGFSQGTATASRWISCGKFPFHSMIVWAGVFAPDIDMKLSAERLKGKSVFLLYGDEDPYRSEERLESQRKMLSDAGVNYEEIEYHGDHRVYPEILKELVTKLES
jgi:predicted esterase